MILIQTIVSVCLFFLLLLLVGYQHSISVNIIVTLKIQKKKVYNYASQTIDIVKEYKKKHMSYHDGRTDKIGRPIVCSFSWTQEQKEKKREREKKMRERLHDHGHY